MNFISRFFVQIRRAGPLVLALGLGIVAAGLGWYYLKSREQQIQQGLISEAESKRTEVVVPVRPLIPGMTLAPDMVAKRSVPTEYLNRDAIVPSDIDEYMGRKVTVAVSEGRPLLGSFFVTPSKLFSEELEPGVRAITIPVDEISSISGMLRAGDHVDFLFIGSEEQSAGKSNGETLVVPLLQDLVVRATGQITSEQFAEMRKRPEGVDGGEAYRRSYTTVTVAVKPLDAQKLILAQRMGKLVAALRNPEDNQKLQQGTDAQTFYSYVDQFRPLKLSAPEMPVNPGTPVEMIIGGSGMKVDRAM